LVIVGPGFLASSATIDDVHANQFPKQSALRPFRRLRKIRPNLRPGARPPFFLEAVAKVIDFFQNRKSLVRLAM
jgi:hypothetical protein